MPQDFATKLEQNKDKLREMFDEMTADEILNNLAESIESTGKDLEKRINENRKKAEAERSALYKELAAFVNENIEDNELKIKLAKKFTELHNDAFKKGVEDGFDAGGVAMTDSVASGLKLIASAYVSSVKGSPDEENEDEQREAFEFMKRAMLNTKTIVMEKYGKENGKNYWLAFIATIMREYKDLYEHLDAEGLMD